MRLTAILVVAVVSAPLLKICLGSDDCNKPWMARDQKCEQLGFKRGTPEHTKCRLELTREATRRRHQID
jgi:hypothetical protein